MTTVPCTECDGTGKKRPFVGAARWWVCEGCNGTGIAASHPRLGLFFLLMSAAAVFLLLFFAFYPE